MFYLCQAQILTDMELHVLLYLMRNCPDCIHDRFGIKPCKAHKPLAEDFMLKHSRNILNKLEQSCS